MGPYPGLPKTFQQTFASESMFSAPTYLEVNLSKSLHPKESLRNVNIVIELLIYFVPRWEGDIRECPLGFQECFAAAFCVYGCWRPDLRASLRKGKGPQPMSPVRRKLGSKRFARQQVCSRGKHL